MKKIHLLGIGLSIFLSPLRSFSQDLTKEDAEEIQYQAKNRITEEYQSLLNTLALPDMGSKAVHDIITSSYSPSSNRIFYNAEVIIEDDVEKGRDGGKTQDMSVNKYLTTFELYYNKSVDPTVVFSDVKVSNVRKKDFLYVDVFFLSVFGGKNKRRQGLYTPVKRVATIRAERDGKKWQTLIAYIGFQKEGQAQKGKEFDVPLAQPKAFADLEVSLNKISNPDLPDRERQEQVKTVVGYFVDEKAEVHLVNEETGSSYDQIPIKQFSGDLLYQPKSTITINRVEKAGDKIARIFLIKKENK